jgi:hypothetical protein
MSQIFGGIVARANSALRDGTDFALVMVGVASAIPVESAFRSFLGAVIPSTIGDDVLTAAIGFAIFYWGHRIHRRLVPFGLGMFLSGIGIFLNGLLAPLFGMLPHS